MSFGFEARLCYILKSTGRFFFPHKLRANSLALRFSNLGRVAQLAEHSALNRQVEGSIPSASTILRISQISS